MAREGNIERMMRGNTDWAGNYKQQKQIQSKDKKIKGFPKA